MHRLQGFAEDFVVHNTSKSVNRIYFQLGNAVAPPVIEVLGRALVDATFAQS
jgi:site-specific DNA-cytosine methylase